MDSIDIGIAVSFGMLAMVMLGMRVAFASAMAGVVGLIWIFWAKFGYNPEQFGKAVTIAAKTAGQVPHSKVSSQALSLIPTFILIGYLAYYAGLTKALFEAAKRWVGWLYISESVVMKYKSPSCVAMCWLILAKRWFGVMVLMSCH